MAHVTSINKQKPIAIAKPSQQQLDGLIDCYQTGRLSDAEKLAISFTQEFPNHQLGWKVLGAIFWQTRRAQEAVNAHQEVINLSPQDPVAYYNLGVTLQELRRLEEAEEIYKQTIMLKPGYAEPHNNLGTVFKELGRLDEAEASYKQAIALKPNFAEAHSNLGVTVQELGRLNEAESICEQAIALKPDYAEAHVNLGVTLNKLGRVYEAEASYTKALTLKPDSVEALLNLGATLNEQGRHDEAEASYEKALEIQPDFFTARSNLLFQLSGFRYEPAKYIKEARLYGQLTAKSVESKFSYWLCQENPKNLRIGFVSGDLRNHPVGFFLEGLLKVLSGSDLKLYAYPNTFFEDDLTARIKPHFEAWHPIFSMSDETAANLIHNHGLHILFDLSGHTSKNRLPLFAWKPAPIQISWLGYFASTGVAEIDYILGDPYVTPVVEAHHFVEKIWQLPESYLCLTEPAVNIGVNSLPVLANGTFTFGCFSRIQRMNDNVIGVWARILKAVPNSTLFLKDKLFSNSRNKEAVYDKFEIAGIKRDRLILESSSPRSEYLVAYKRVDIALAPFPYGGGTTSAEGLWMGVPVISMRGNHFLSHLGESIAHNAGLSNWIASDEDDYVAKAIEFASNLDDLAILRSKLRAQVLSSPLFNIDRFKNEFELALHDMWKVKQNTRI